MWSKWISVDKNYISNLLKYLLSVFQNLRSGTFCHLHSFFTLRAKLFLYEICIDISLSGSKSGGARLKVKANFSDAHSKYFVFIRRFSLSTVEFCDDLGWLENYMGI